MAVISKEEVKKISKLANIPLQEEKSTIFSEQLSNILSFVDALALVDTKNSSPLDNVIGLKNVFREDEVSESLSQEEALSNAKSTYHGFFKIKAIFEK